MRRAGYAIGDEFLVRAHGIRSDVEPPLPPSAIRPIGIDFRERTASAPFGDKTDHTYWPRHKVGQFPSAGDFPLGQLSVSCAAAILISVASISEEFRDRQPD